MIISLQTTTMVLLLRYSRTLHASSPDQLTSQEQGNIFPKESDDESLQENPVGQHYVISTAVFLSEILKLIISMLFLHVNNGQ